jgi:hypothetical protein
MLADAAIGSRLQLLGTTPAKLRVARANVAHDEHALDHRGKVTNRIIYIIGFVVVLLALASWLGLR